MKAPLGTVYGMMLLVLVMTGCSGYGTIAVQRGDGDKVTLKRLVEEREKYNVTFMESTHRCALSLIFDPKGDDRTLRSSQWSRVDSEESLGVAVDRIRALQNPDVSLLLGPDGDPFGYLYGAGRGRVYLKAIDARTMEVHLKPNPCPSAP